MIQVPGGKLKIGTWGGSLLLVFTYALDHPTHLRTVELKIACQFHLAVGVLISRFREQPVPIGFFPDRLSKEFLEA